MIQCNAIYVENGTNTKARERVMNKCSQCDSEEIYSMDTDDHECKCGAVYCGNCDAEFSKEGELLAYGKVMQ